MTMDNKMLLDLAEQLGFSESAAKSKIEECRGKSDEEILQEIGKIKETLKKDRKMYEKQIRAAKALSSTMNEQQRMRLQKVIEFLES